MDILPYSRDRALRPPLWCEQLDAAQAAALGPSLNLNFSARQSVVFVAANASYTEGPATPRDVQPSQIEAQCDPLRDESLWQNAAPIRTRTGAGACRDFATAAPE